MAGIIKASDGMRAGQSGEPVAFQLVDVVEHSAAQLAAARAQAQEILTVAKREAEALRQRAEQQGHQAAQAKAEQLKRREVAAQMETVLPALRQAVESFAGLRQHWVRQWEHSLIHLACRIAGRVIRREVRDDPQIPLTLLREALELAAGQQSVQVLLHPDDLKALGEEVSRLTEAWNRAGPTDIRADPAVPRGSCRVTSEYGDIDQRFEQQLSRIEQELSR